MPHAKFGIFLPNFAYLAIAMVLLVMPVQFLFLVRIAQPENKGEIVSQRRGDMPESCHGAGFQLVTHVADQEKRQRIAQFKPGLGSDFRPDPGWVTAGQGNGGRGHLRSM